MSLLSILWYTLVVTLERTNLRRGGNPRTRMPSVVNLDDGVQGSIQLLVGLEEGELYDEEVLERLAAQLCYEFARRLCRSACKAADLY